MSVSREICAVDEKNVGISVVVVVDEGAAGAHGFGEPLLAEGAVVVGEVDSGLGGDVAEVDLLCLARQRERLEPRDMVLRHSGTEEASRKEVLDLSVPL